MFEWNTQEQQEQVRKTLTEKILTVTFTKNNGDNRIMACTLQEDQIPKATKEDPLSQKKIRKINPEVCAVWDLNAQGWRSFRWDKVIAIKEGRIDVLS